MGGLIDFLVPKEKKFISMLMVQSDILLEGAREFNNFVIGFDCLNKEEILKKRWDIKEIEHQGDYITRKIINSLHESFITPIDREDILVLTQSTEEIIDFIDDTTTKIVIYDVKKMPENMVLFSKNILECCKIIKHAMYHLKSFNEVKRAIISLHHIEVQADSLFFASIDGLFKKKIDIKDLIKFKEIYESAEEAINMCDKVGDIFGKIVVNHG